MEEKSVYDARKKILTRTIKEELPLEIDKKKVGEHTSHTVQTYDVEGIKAVYAELKRQREQVMQTLNAANRVLEVNKDLVETEEMKELRQMLEDIQKLKNKVQAEAQHKHALEQLEEVNKQIGVLQDAVKGHIKL